MEGETWSENNSDRFALEWEREGASKARDEYKVIKKQL